MVWLHRAVWEMSVGTRSFVCALSVFALLLGGVSCEFDANDGTSSDGWRFLSMFCFDKYSAAALNRTDMSIDVTLHSETIPEDMLLLLYDDHTWGDVYKNSQLTCQQKVVAAKFQSVVFWDQNKDWVLAPTYYVRETDRPTFWYVVAANCDEFQEIQWKIQFYNTGSNWAHQFGVNEQGLNSLYVVFFTFGTLVVLIHCVGVVPIWRKLPLHPILKLVTAALFFQWLGITAQLIHYLLFTSDGVGSPPAHGASILFRVAARMCFILLLILLAKGWTISDLELKGKSRVGQILGIFLALYLGLLIWDLLKRDPAATEFIYDSVPGILISIVDVLTGIWYIGTLRHTHKHENVPHKKAFYRRIGWIYGVWFLTLPFAACLALGLASYVREIATETITLVCDCLAYWIMVFILWPSRAEEYFTLVPPDLDPVEFGYCGGNMSFSKTSSDTGARATQAGMGYTKPLGLRTRKHPKVFGGLRANSIGLSGSASAGTGGGGSRWKFLEERKHPINSTAIVNAVNEWRGERAAASGAGGGGGAAAQPVAPTPLQHPPTAFPLPSPYGGGHSHGLGSVSERDGLSTAGLRMMGGLMSPPTGVGPLDSSVKLPITGAVTVDPNSTSFLAMYHRQKAAVAGGGPFAALSPHALSAAAAARAQQLRLERTAQLQHEQELAATTAAAAAAASALANDTAEAQASGIGSDANGLTNAPSAGAAAGDERVGASRGNPNHRMFTETSGGGSGGNDTSLDASTATDGSNFLSPDRPPTHPGGFVRPHMYSSAKHANQPKRVTVLAPTAADDSTNDSRSTSRAGQHASADPSDSRMAQVRSPSPVIIWRPSARVKLATDIPPELRAVFLNDQQSTKREFDSQAALTGLGLEEQKRAIREREQLIHHNQNSRPPPDGSTKSKIRPKTVRSFRDKNHPPDRPLPISSFNPPPERDTNKIRYGAWYIPPLQWRVQVGHDESDLTSAERNLEPAAGTSPNQNQTQKQIAAAAHRHAHHGESRTKTYTAAVRAQHELNGTAPSGSQLAALRSSARRELAAATAATTGSGIDRTGGAAAKIASHLDEKEARFRRDIPELFSSKAYKKFLLDTGAARIPNYLDAVRPLPAFGMTNRTAGTTDPAAPRDDDDGEGGTLGATRFLGSHQVREHAAREREREREAFYDESIIGGGTAHVFPPTQ